MSSKRKIIVEKNYIDRPISAKQVAEYLEIPVRRVYEIVQMGELHPTKRLGKLFFDPNEVLAYDNFACECDSRVSWL